MKKLLTILFAVALGLNLSAQVPDYVPTEGLVAWYPFNGNANDESGNEQDGEIVGAQLTVDRFGSNESAYSFDHTRIEIENSATNDQFKTISFWFMSSSTAGNQVAFKQNIYVGHEYERVSCAMQWSETHFAGKQVCNTGWQYDNVGGEVNDGIWHHYVGIFDSTQKRLYIDGTLLDESEFNPENMCSGGDLIIGQEWDGVPYDFIGDLDDFGFWSRALSEEEILALHNAPAPTPGCTDSAACNYDDEANEDDGSCTYPPFGLTDCEAGGALCGEGTIWDASLQACVGFNDCPSDLDGDGLIGVEDLLSLLSDFGTDCVASDDPETVEFTCGDPMNYHGYDYATVQIGEQCWFAENLRSELYQNGDSIENNLAESEWESSITGAVAVYGEGESNCNSYTPDYESCDEEWSLSEYGRLYNWYSVQDARDLCPVGWHVPADWEWTDMTDFLGGASTAADQLKATYGWLGGENGANSSGFNALPGGVRNVYGAFDVSGSWGNWWSSSLDGNGDSAWYRGIHCCYPYVQRNDTGFTNGISVRCIKDTEE